ncbi:MAG: response regulator transcription factor [Candidatus Hydrogenedentes bacterium]|nr:response regulator transcription factor [Candidatus Hydrogenedentota bacterium]
MEKKNIAIVDDHPVVRLGLKQLICEEPDLSVCWQAEDVDEAKKKTAEMPPHVVIVDITLRSSNGLDFLLYLGEHAPQVRALVVSMHDEVVYAERALRLGARGYLMKQDADERVIEAIRKLLSGGLYVSEEQSERLLQALVAGKPATMEERFDLLSRRELAVFNLLGEGRNTREIAGELDLNAKTVETYRRRIKAKLGIDSTSQLTYRAIEWVMHQRSGNVR